ncbi:MAG: hypothetical protein KA250_02435 [Verrucomicrobiales bacterium]|nr:hypothetical protein [Verrucomicrobiales bacterium]MBP9225310.1 hypothetical protein [Verrucomicrobiales bacterium]
MQAIYDFLYEPGIPLKWMGILIGVFLISSHAMALLKPDLVKPWLKKFPRNEKIGIILVIIAFAWTLIIWSGMDLQEFFKIERTVQLILIAGCIGVIVYVKEFLAVRALGFLMILAAAPILDSAFLKEPQTRLLIVALAYAIALKGMFWVGMPYLLRDQINWVLAKDKRFTIGAILGVVYGLVVLICAVVLW